MKKSAFEIPSPCPEPWEAMTPKGAGRHCASCDKVVVDISRMTEKAAVSLIRENVGNICVNGLYDPASEKFLYRPEAKRRLPVILNAATAFAMAACSPATRAAENSSPNYAQSSAPTSGESAFADLQNKPENGPNSRAKDPSHGSRDAGVPTPPAPPPEPVRMGGAPMPMPQPPRARADAGTSPQHADAGVTPPSPPPQPVMLRGEPTVNGD